MRLQASSVVARLSKGKTEDEAVGGMCKSPLLAFAAAAFNLMPRFLEVAGLFRIEFCLSSANLTNQCVEVVRVLFVPDERGKNEFLDGHRDLLLAQHNRGSNFQSA